MIEQVTVFSYNRDEFSSLLEAKEAGIFSEIDVTESEWDMFRKSTYFASVNYSGEMYVEIHHSGHVIDECGIWNIPEKFPSLEPTYIVSVVVCGKIHVLHSNPMNIKELKGYLDVKLIESLKDDGIVLPVSIDPEQVYAYQFNNEPYLIKRIK